MPVPDSESAEQRLKKINVKGGKLLTNKELWQ